MTEKMKVNVDFTDYKNLSDDKKSLVNFLMENGVLYFLGQYGTDDEDETLSNMSGNLCLTSRTISSNGLSYNVIAPYGELTTDVHNFVLTNTYLLEKSSNLNLIGFDFVENEFTVYNNVFSTPVKFTPKIGSIVNENQKLVPKYLATNQNDNVIIVPIEKENKKFKYDIQLRTPTITLKYYNVQSDSYTYKDLFLKIGIVSLGQEDNIAYIKDNLLLNHNLLLDIQQDTLLSYYLSYYNHLQFIPGLSPIEPVNPRNVVLQNETNFIGEEYYFYTYKESGEWVGESATASTLDRGLARTIILPLQKIIESDVNDQLSYKEPAVIGLLYIKLCDSNTGELYSDPLPSDSLTLCKRYIENGQNIENLNIEQKLTSIKFIDHDLEKGFIPVDDLITLYTVPDKQSPLPTLNEQNNNCELYTADNTGIINFTNGNNSLKLVAVYDVNDELLYEYVESNHNLWSFSSSVGYKLYYYGSEDVHPYKVVFSQYYFDPTSLL